MRLTPTRVGLILLAIAIAIFGGAMSFGDYIPAWYAYPALVLITIFFAAGLVCLMPAIERAAEPIADRLSDWLREERS